MLSSRPFVLLPDDANRQAGRWIDERVLVRRSRDTMLALRAELVDLARCRILGSLAQRHALSHVLCAVEAGEHPIVSRVRLLVDPPQSVPDERQMPRRRD